MSHDQPDKGANRSPKRQEKAELARIKRRIVAKRDRKSGKTDTNAFLNDRITQGEENIIRGRGQTQRERDTSRAIGRTARKEKELLHKVLPKFFKKPKHETIPLHPHIQALKRKK